MRQTPEAGVNAPATPPPEPDVQLTFDDLPTPPAVPPFSRWRCPLCGASFRHPWYLAAHLNKPSKLGMPHGLPEDEAWCLAATVAPVDTSPGLTRYPTLPVVPMAAPPSVAAR